MAPPRPKRPGRPRLVVKPDGGKPAKDELPFDAPEDTEAEAPRPAQPTAARPPLLPSEELAPARPSRPRHDVDVLVGEDPGIPERGYSTASLYVEKGPGAGQLVPLRQGPLLIGRGTSADLRLLHPSISRKHAEVSREGERFFVRDLGSQNGTFLNRLRVAGRTELLAGDELALGNAVLRLRGTQPEGTARPTRASPPPPEHGPGRGSRALRAAVLVAAATSGLALVLLVAMVKMRSATPPAPERAEGTVVQGEGAVQAVEERAVPLPAPGAVAPVEARPAVANGGTQLPVDSEVSASAAQQAPRAAPPPPAVAAGKQAERQAVRAVSAEAVLRQQQRAPAAPAVARSAVAPVAQPAVSGPVSKAAPGGATGEAGATAAPGVMDAYEGGDVVRALVLARQGGHAALVEPLARFQQAYDAGKRALAARNGPEAIRHFTAALRVDEALSRGWGTYGPELHEKLAHLHLLSGLQHAQQGSRDAARRDLEAVLAHDPDNARAQSELAKLKESTPASAPAREEVPKTDRKAAIEDAWGDE